MSIGRLLLAVRNQIRTGLSLTDQECDVMPGPEPPPACGEKFVSIYGSSWSAGGEDIYQDRGIYETYDIVCAVTFRSAYAPFDRLGTDVYVKRLLGIEDFCRKVMKQVHHNTAINTAVDTMISDDHDNPPTFTPSGMVEYLRWVSTDPNPLPVTGSWFNSDEAASSGLVMEVRFNQATRFSSFESGVTDEENFV